MRGGRRRACRARRRSAPGRWVRAAGEEQLGNDRHVSWLSHIASWALAAYRNDVVSVISHNVRTFGEALWVALLLDVDAASSWVGLISFVRYHRTASLRY